MIDRDKAAEELLKLAERFNNRMWVWRPCNQAAQLLKSDGEEIATATDMLAESLGTSPE